MMLTGMPDEFSDVEGPSAWYKENSTDGLFAEDEATRGTHHYRSCHLVVGLAEGFCAHAHTDTAREIYRVWGQKDIVVKKKEREGGWSVTAEQEGKSSGKGKKRKRWSWTKKV